MFPAPPLFINDGLSFDSFAKRSIRRRQWLIDRCTAPILLSGPRQGPNQMYAWAHCFAPVYQDSYLLFLTGINQLNIQIILDPQSGDQHIFLPEMNEDRVFWDGAFFAYNDSRSYDFLTSLGFNKIHSTKTLSSVINQLKTGHWSLLIQKSAKKIRPDENYLMKRTLARKFGKRFKFTNICSLSWEQRLVNDDASINCIKEGAKKTQTAFHQTLKNQSFESEMALSGRLIGELLSETSYGLSFSPIIAKNENAAILHYTNNSDSLTNHDLVLMDFGLRWHSMCTDVSRTIPIGGTYTRLQRILMDIVIDTQEAVIKKVAAGICFNELNLFAWDYLERLLKTRFINVGGQVERYYKKQPHNIGHLLGIQVHDGDSNRDYRDQPLPANAIITIEPGLYGTFELDGHRQTLGIRIEDNVIVKKEGAINLTQDIPKRCEDIEAILKT